LGSWVVIKPNDPFNVWTIRVNNTGIKKKKKKKGKDQKPNFQVPIQKGLKLIMMRWAETYVLALEGKI
jgi:hypothetical protein